METWQQSSSKSLTILSGITGVILFSSKAVLVKLAYQYEVDAVTLLLFRMLFSLPFYLAVALINKPASNSNLRRTDYFWLIGFGIIGYYLASYFDFLGLQHIKASLERIILFVYPTLVLIINAVFFKSPIKKEQVIAILITYGGIIITFSEELAQTSEGQQIILGGILVFLSALTYASYLAGSGWLIPKFGAVTFTSYAMIVSCICVILHYISTRSEDLPDFPAEVYWLSFTMAIVATVVPSYLISYAIKGLGASNFAIFGSLGPISTIILANIFLGERMTWLQLLGTGVVILGVMYISRKKKAT